MDNSVAYLNNKGRYIVFSYGNKTIRFIASKNLERLVSVTEWDNGYIVVQSKNYNREPEEDYIDLIPILENLLIDPVEFLKPIKEVQLNYAGQ